MISEWRYIGKQLFERGRYKWILIFFALLFAAAIVLPKEQFKRIKNAYKSQEIWITDSYVSLETVSELERWKDIETVYPLYKLQAGSIGEEKKEFDLYGICGNYISDSKAEEMIFLPKKLGFFISNLSSQTLLTVGKEKHTQKEYVFSNTRKSKNNVAYISGDTAEKIIRETGAVAGYYDGVCLKITSAASAWKIEKLIKKIQGVSLNDLSVLKEQYKEGRDSLMLFVFYLTAGILVIEVLISLMTENLWNAGKIQLHKEKIMEDNRKKVKIYWFVKMNGIFISIVVTAVVLAILGVV